MKLAGVADTHAVIWYIHSDPRLSASAKSFIENAARNGQKIGIASITLIELIYLIEKGRIAAESFSRLTRAIEETNNVFSLIPLTLETARALMRVDVTKVPDMPDRIIAATALAFSVPVVSKDSKIQVSGLNTIW